MLRDHFPRDANGHSVGDPLGGYVVTDGPTAAEAVDDILYYLAMTINGSWYIRKRTISTGTERFAFGRGDAVTAWTNRVSQTYDRVNVIF